MSVVSLCEHVLYGKHILYFNNLIIIKHSKKKKMKYLKCLDSIINR